MKDGLSVEESAARYAAERAQGEALVASSFEAAWGWSGKAGERRAERRAAFLAAATALGPQVRCLELGAGTGEFTVRLADSGCRLVALELSEALAERCRARIPPGVEVVVGNAETGEGLGERRFDAIVGVSVLHHVNLELALRNTFSHLAPGGRFAFSEPNLLNPQIWVERHVGPVRRSRHVVAHETAFTVRSLRRVFERAGLEVEVCEPFDFLHPATPSALVPLVERLQRLLEVSPARVVAGSVRIAGRKPS